MINHAKSCNAFRSLDEAELNGIAGGRMKLQGPGQIPSPYGSEGGGKSFEAREWRSEPVYLGPF